MNYPSNINPALTFEKVWEMFQETDKKFQETREQIKKTDKKINKAIDLFNGQWGRLVESLVEGDLINMLKRQGVQVNQTFTRLKYKYNKKNGEIDIVAANGKEVVVVEVKTNLKPEDVEEFLETLKIFKKNFPIYKHESIYGAVAFIRTESKSEIRAERLGLFVIRATGNSATIINQKGFSPKTF